MYTLRCSCKIQIKIVDIIICKCKYIKVYTCTLICSLEYRNESSWSPCDFTSWGKLKTCNGTEIKKVQLEETIKNQHIRVKRPMGWNQITFGNADIHHALALILTNTTVLINSINFFIQFDGNQYAYIS